MATQTITRTGLHYRLPAGKYPEFEVLPEADSQTFVAGDLVYSSAGSLTICGADPALIRGIAMGDATNVTSGHKDILILRITDDLDVGLNCYHATAASAVLAATNVDDQYEIVKNAAGKWCIDIANQVSNRVTIQANPVHPWGDVYGIVFVRFIAANIQP